MGPQFVFHSNRKTEAKAKAMAVPAEAKAKAMAVPAMAAPAVEPLAVAASGDCVAPKKKGFEHESKVCPIKGLLHWQGQS